MLTNAFLGELEYMGVTMMILVMLVILFRLPSTYM